MRVTVLFFAAARELAGCRRAPQPCKSTRSLSPLRNLFMRTELALAPRSEAQVDAPDACTACALLALLAAAHPGLDALYPTLQLAVNQRYAPRDALLAPGDEVALIPPISGG